jgi:hypothetical protein
MLLAEDGDGERGLFVEVLVVIEIVVEARLEVRGPTRVELLAEGDQTSQRTLSVTRRAAFKAFLQQLADDGGLGLLRLARLKRNPLGKCCWEVELRANHNSVWLL